jgi:hypothetical protein
MYSTCLFCNNQLGANEAVESFPVGRRIAFDAAKGRLWVVCRKCERWNLSPLEERWEAVEECERLFRETRMRASTENIGLARLHEGLELVRIGQPQRPEFAAWRYGDQFGRRRRRFIAYSAGAVAVVGAVVVGGSMAGILSGGLLSQTGNIINVLVNARTRLKLKTDEGRVIKLNNHQLQSVVMVPPAASPEAAWRIMIGSKKKEMVFRGPEAERLAAVIVPKLNSAGGSAANVQAAVKHLEERGGPEGFLQSDVLDPRATGTHIAAARGRRAVKARGPGGEPVLYVARLPTPTRLAIEMALHEEQERRALEGELKALEAAWREAEQIAAIADDLLLPSNTDSFLEKHRKTGSG